MFFVFFFFNLIHYRIITCFNATNTEREREREGGKKNLTSIEEYCKTKQHIIVILLLLHVLCGLL